MNLKKRIEALESRLIVDPITLFFADGSSAQKPDIQCDLFYDDRKNVDAYPKWQAWMHENQPLLLVISGKYDLLFDLSEPEAFCRDVSNAQVPILETSHFALDTAADEIGELVRGFVASSH